MCARYLKRTAQCQSVKVDDQIDTEASFIERNFNELKKLGA